MRNAMSKIIDKRIDKAMKRKPRAPLPPMYDVAAIVHKCKTDAQLKACITALKNELTRRQQVRASIKYNESVFYGTSKGIESIRRGGAVRKKGSRREAAGTDV